MYLQRHALCRNWNEAYRLYLIVDRAPVNLQPLVEEYALYDQVGYVGFEFLDAKLIRPEAIKVIQITG